MSNKNERRGGSPLTLRERTIVELGWCRDHKTITAIAEELLRRIRRVRGGGEGKGETRVDVFAGDEVPTRAMHNHFDRIERNKVSGVLYAEILWFSECFHTFVRLHPVGTSDAHGYRTHAALVLHNAADGGRFGAWEGYGVAVCREERVQFLIPEIGVCFT